MKSLTKLFTIFLWSVGLFPTVIMLAAVVIFYGTPISCPPTRACLEHHGDDLLILPAATLIPFIAGIALGLRKDRKAQKVTLKLSRANSGRAS